MYQKKESKFVEGVSRRARKQSRSNGLLRNSLVACAALVTSLIVPSAAGAHPLTPDQFRVLATTCAPSVAIDALRAVAAKESGFDPLALHNNTRKRTIHAKDAAAAVALADEWMAAGDSIDLGLMQIHTSNLLPQGLNVETAFNACASLAAGAAILQTAYSRGAPAAEEQAALLIAYSRYNTGRALDGVVNGYAPDVLARTGSRTSLPDTDKAGPALPESDAWNVWRAASAPRLAWFSNYSSVAEPVVLTATTSPFQPSTAGD
jgi:type IV secretion system protein VirB1